MDTLFQGRQQFDVGSLRSAVPTWGVRHCAVSSLRVSCCLQQMSVCAPLPAVLKTKDALDLLVMTGMGFDAQGHRLGRGGG